MRHLRNFLGTARVPALAALGAVAGYVALASLSPWSPLATLRHLAAFPHCAAARAVGLAPSNRGAPGYWPHHDAAGDGFSCRLQPDRRRGSGSPDRMIAALTLAAG